MNINHIKAIYTHGFYGNSRYCCDSSGNNRYIFYCQAKDLRKFVVSSNVSNILNCILKFPKFLFSIFYIPLLEL